MSPKVCAVRRKIVGCVGQDYMYNDKSVAVNSYFPVTCPHKVAEGCFPILPQPLSLVDDVYRSS